MESVESPDKTFQLSCNHLEQLWRLNFPPPYEKAIPPCKITKDSYSPMRKHRAWWEHETTIGDTLWPAYKQLESGELRQIPNVW